MPWLQVETTLGQRHPQTLEDAFTELGAVAVWLRDAGDEPVLEPAPGETPGWSETIVAALFEDNGSAKVLHTALRNALPDIELTVRPVADRDWQSEWQQSLRPQRFGDRLWILPDDTDAPDGAAIVRLQPGLAFGTGDHATTAMCLKWLTKRSLQHHSVLDYGCGSGLLAIAALALGARHACAVDIDPQALDATRSNACNNDCEERLLIVKPDAVPTDTQYDVLVANILSGILIELGPVLRPMLRPGAPLALTGILAHQAETVRSAWAAWADLGVDDQIDDWVLLSGNKHETL
jgi:ribosomal protein L11 methyltransferase